MIILLAVFLILIYLLLSRKIAKWIFLLGVSQDKAELYEIWVLFVVAVILFALSLFIVPARIV